MDEAKELIRKHDLADISEEYVTAYCEVTGIIVDDFNVVMEKYRNTDIWKQRADGTWHIPGHLEDE